MNISKIQNSIIQETQKAITRAVDNVTKPLAESSEKGLPSHEMLNVSHFPNFAMCQSHKAEGGLAVVYPKSYVHITKELVPEYEWTRKKMVREIMPDGSTKLVRKIVTSKEPEHWEETATWLPHYHLDKLWTTGRGSGTNSVQDLVRKSLQDPKTQGRVMLDACCIDGETAPGGFYYKLGFRFINESVNKECQEWIAKGGKREDAPFAIGIMYLPKENISQCLNYRVKS
ncbi:hypothetical protein HDR58_01200 [bacterium]|nr:hypothetical protein [bacterium]